jgi:GT2 family glycosyltransferase
MKISASVVLYKHSKAEVEPTLASLLSCSGLKRLVLVDNAGCAWASHCDDSRVMYVNPGKNVGYGRGHNIAFAACRSAGSHHVVCNPDVTFEAGTLEKIYGFATARKAGVVMPDVIYPNGDRQYLCKLLPSAADLFIRRFLPFASAGRTQEYELRHADYTRDFFVPNLSGCFMFVCREAFEHTGGFDERFFMYMEDTDLSRRIADVFPTYFFSGASITHRYAKASYKLNKLFLYHLASAFRYFSKWGWFIDRRRVELNRRCLNQLPRASN